MEEQYLDEDGEIQYYAVRPNKSKQKRELADLFALGDEMSMLSNAQREDLNLPENIAKSVAEVAKMSHKAARKRQLKYIAGQLNKIPLDEIQEKMDRLRSQSVHAVREHHQAERWRDRLVGEEGKAALTELLSLYPQADSQQLRQLQRNAKKEFQTQKPPKSSRLLYQYLKTLVMTE